MGQWCAIVGRSKLEKDRVALGIAEALALFRLNLERGDITFCFPDGLVEHQGREFVGGALSCTGGKNFAGTG